MIVGIGIDAVDIARFSNWYTYSTKKLGRVFSEDEIAYCMLICAKTKERFAARFAAKEAFYKAFFAAYPSNTIPFLTLCKAISLYSSVNRKPELLINWEILGKSPLTCHISLTHTATMATAFVILETKIS